MSKPQCLPSISAADSKHAVRDSALTNIAPTIYSRTPSQINHFKSAVTPQNEYDGQVKFGAKGNYRLVSNEQSGRESLDLR